MVSVQTPSDFVLITSDFGPANPGGTLAPGACARPPRRRRTPHNRTKNDPSLPRLPFLPPPSPILSKELLESFESLNPAPPQQNP